MDVGGGQNARQPGLRRLNALSTILPLPNVSLPAAMIGYIELTCNVRRFDSIRDRCLANR